MPRTRSRVGRSAGVAEHRCSEAPLWHRAVADDLPHPRRARSRASLALALAGAPSSASRADLERVDRATPAPRSTRPPTSGSPRSARSPTSTSRSQTLDQDAWPTIEHARRQAPQGRRRTRGRALREQHAGARRHERHSDGRRPARARAPGRAHRPGERRRPGRDRPARGVVADLDARRDRAARARPTQTSTLRLPRRPAPRPRHASSRRSSWARRTPRPEPSWRPRSRRHQDDAVAQAATRPTVVALDVVAPGRPARASRRRPRRSPPPRRSGRAASARITTTRSSCAPGRGRATATTASSAPAGYYGAYQFAPTTWNVTASHAGPPRPRRRAAVAGVGVRPGRDGVGALPVAGQRPVGRSLLATRSRSSSATASRRRASHSASDAEAKVGG